LYPVPWKYGQDTKWTFTEENSSEKYPVLWKDPTPNRILHGSGYKLEVF